MKWLSKYKKMVLRRMLADRRFCIISNDCWGGEVYRKLDVQYNTPFVGLFVMAPCYIQLLNDLRVIKQEMRFVSSSKYSECNTLREELNNSYPIGVLPGDIEIHFQHYGSEEKALGTWRRRLGRMNWENLCVKFDAGKDLATAAHVKEFGQLDFSTKLCIVSHLEDCASWEVHLSDWEQDGAKMFRKYASRFSVIKWLNGRGIQRAGYLEPWLIGISRRRKKKPSLSATRPGDLEKNVDAANVS